MWPVPEDLPNPQVRANWMVFPPAPAYTSTIKAQAQVFAWLRAISSGVTLYHDSRRKARQRRVKKRPTPIHLNALIEPLKEIKSTFPPAENLWITHDILMTLESEL